MKEYIRAFILGCVCIVYIYSMYLMGQRIMFN
jgi:hypothetical protein